MPDIPKTARGERLDDGWWYVVPTRTETRHGRLLRRPAGVTGSYRCKRVGDRFVVRVDVERPTLQTTGESAEAVLREAGLRPPTRRG